MYSNVVLDVPLKHLFEVSRSLDKNICPEAVDIFAPLKITKPNDVKAVILGQDPYPRLVDAKGIVPAIKAANAAGVPVITVDTDAYGGDVRVFVGSDNVKGGELAASYIVEQLKGTGTVAVLDDVPGKAAIMDRIAGFRSIMEAWPGVDIVTVQPAYGRRDRAVTVTENILQAHPDVDAIFATADAMALGAMSVLQAVRRQQPVILVGFDACEEAVQAIQRGTLQADIAQFPDRIGRAFIENAMKVLRNEPVPGKVPIPVTLVTADNADNYAVQ